MDVRVSGKEVSTDGGGKELGRADGMELGENVGGIFDGVGRNDWGVVGVGETAKEDGCEDKGDEGKEKGDSRGVQVAIKHYSKAQFANIVLARL
jgi:hypothetical protein